MPKLKFVAQNEECMSSFVGGCGTSCLNALKTADIQRLTSKFCVASIFLSFSCYSNGCVAIEVNGAYTNAGIV